MAVSHFHPRISVAYSVLAACTTSRGERGLWRCQDMLICHAVCGSGTTRSHTAVSVSHGRSVIVVDHL